MSTKTFANNLIRTQKAFSLNNTDLSYVLGTSRRTLGRIKSATPYYTPSEETIETIADAYGVAPQQVTKRLKAAVIASVL
jgi:transcriptional regulator with XRE-family HTH domain